MRLSYNGQYTSLPSWGRGFDTPQPLQRNESYQTAHSSATGFFVASGFYQGSKAAMA